MKTVQLEIFGKVQGVFFRVSAKEIAEMNKISGWIKNTREGNVEALITGETDAVQKFIDWCNNGPEKAIVDSVTIIEKPFHKFDKFEILR